MVDIMKYLKLLIKTFIFFSLHIFYIFPIKKDTVLFSSFHGKQYSCNPKYLYEYLIKHGIYKNYVWEFSDVSKKCLVPNACVVRSRSISHTLALLTAEYIITNTESPWYYPKRKRQKFLQTWHGGGAYKKVGGAVGWGVLENYEQKLNSRKIDYYISSSAKFTEVQSFSKYVDCNKFINTGMPRNSLFFDEQKGIRNNVINEYSINESDKLVLYAPTYRGSPDFKNYQLDIPILNFHKIVEALSQSFGGSWKVLQRGHYFYNNNSTSEGIINASSYEDMQELLVACDVLLTDYSSTIWDFSFTRKPCFLFVPDLDTYDRDRSFYTKPETWPFPLARTEYELISNIVNYDQETNNFKTSNHIKELASYENSDASRQVLEAIGIIS